jgi:6-phosphogluconolactonase
MTLRARLYKLTGSVLLLLFILAVVSSAADLRYLVYVGTYTDKGSTGIYAYRFDPSSGELGDMGLVATTDNPSFLAVAADNKYLYALNEINKFNGGETGAVTTFALDGTSGKLTQLQQVSSLGPGPAHLSIDRSGKYLLVANYDGGSVAVFPRENDGTLGARTSFVQHSGSSINKDRQSGPHAHEIQATADNKYVFVAELGLDELLLYRFNANTGTLSSANPPFVKVAPGSGPRHFAIAPSGKYIYLVNELSSTVAVYSFDASSGRLTELQTISTLPHNFKGENTTAEIATDAAGKFVYASNRGDDSIAIFAIDQKSGKLSSVDRVKTGGKEPRHFTLDPTGNWLFAENENSNDIRIFRVDPKSGRLSPTSHSMQVNSPVCVVFVPSQ